MRHQRAIDDIFRGGNWIWWESKRGIDYKKINFNLLPFSLFNFDVHCTTNSISLQFVSIINTNNSRDIYIYRHEFSKIRSRSFIPTCCRVSGFRGGDVRSDLEILKVKICGPLSNRVDQPRIEGHILISIMIDPLPPSTFFYALARVSIRIVTQFRWTRTIRRVAQPLLCSSIVAMRGSTRELRRRGVDRNESLSISRNFSFFLWDIQT